MTQRITKIRTTALLHGQLESMTNPLQRIVAMTTVTDYESSPSRKLSPTQWTYVVTESTP